MSISRFKDAEQLHVQAGRPAPTVMRPVAPWLFAAAMAASVAVSLLAGTTLGYMAAMQHSIGATHWSEAVQAHGRLQLVGWAAVFVTALMFEFGVRLNQRPALPVAPRAVALAALGGGALLSAAGQLWHDDIGVLFPLGAAVAAGGALVAAALVLRIPAPRPLADDLQPLWFRLAAGTLAVALVLEFVSALRAEAGIIALDESRLTAELLLRGFILPAVLGVAMRAFPGHLGCPLVSQGRQRFVWAAVAASLGVWALGSGAYGLPEADLLRRAGDLLLAAPLLAVTAWLGMPAMARTARSAGRVNVMAGVAWLGLVLYAVCLAVEAVLPGFGDRSLFEEGALRHLFLVGFMAPLMVAMANIVLARFATGRVYWRNALAAAFVAIVVAAPLRVLPPLLEDPPGDVGQWSMGIAAGVFQVGLALFAAVCARNAVAALKQSRQVRAGVFRPGIHIHS